MISILATIVKFDRERAFYPAVMIVIASYYGLFAVMGSSVKSLAIESVIILVFLVTSNSWVQTKSLDCGGSFVRPRHLRFFSRLFNIKPRCSGLVGHVLPDL